MENEVWGDVMLAVALLAVFAFGFFILKRLDKFLDKNFRYDHSDDEPTEEKSKKEKFKKGKPPKGKPTEKRTDENSFGE